MSGRRNQIKSRSNSPCHVFVEQNPASFPRGGSKIVSSQARRFQSAGKRRKQEAAAHENAVYARSLVGWNSHTPKPLPAVSSPASSRAVSRDRGLSTESEYPAKLFAPHNDKAWLQADTVHASPTTDSSTVMLMVDYFIHVWSPHNCGFFDACIGYDTQLTICWPMAMRDEMFFDATIAVSRIAYILSQGNSAADDPFMLYHRGLALTRLQKRLNHETAFAEVEVIFTIGRMLWIAYMTNERDAFNFHFEAYQKLVEQYISANPGTDISRINDNRLRSWTALHAYRGGHDLLQESSATGSISSRQSSRQPSPLKHDLQATSNITRLPSVFTNVPLTSATISHLDCMHRLLRQLRSERAYSPKTAFDISQIRSHIGQTIAAVKLSKIESQLGCGLLAFASQVYDLHAVLKASTVNGISPCIRDPTAGRHDQDIQGDGPPIFEVAQTFLNKKLSSFHNSPQHRIILAWSALALGSYLLNDLDVYLRRKGHIILISLFCEMRNTAIHPLQFSDNIFNGKSTWEVLELMLQNDMGDFWHESLVTRWRRDWIATIARQRDWEKRGLWDVGVPKTLSLDGRSNGHDRIDIVEYLVFRDAKDALPMID